jgi:hypothetical protein
MMLEWWDDTAQKWVNTLENLNASQAKDESRKSEQDAPRHEGVQIGGPEIRLECQGEIPEAGDSDRTVGVGPVSEEFVNGFEIEHRQKAEEAALAAAIAARDAASAARVTSQPKAAISVRVHLTGGTWIDMGINVPWSDWVTGLINWHGIAWDKGYIPLAAVQAVIHHDANGAAELSGNLSGNVVQFPGGKK